MYQPVALPKAAVMHIGQVASWQVRVIDMITAEQAGMILLTASAALAGATMVLILLVRQSDQIGRDSTRAVYRLDFPRDLALDQVVAFIRALVGLRPPRWSLLGRSSIVFEVVAHEGINTTRTQATSEARPTLLTTKEASAALRVSVWKLYDLIHRRQIETIKIGKRRLVPLDSLTRLIDKLREETL